MQTALKAAGIEMVLGKSMTVTGSTREAETYYLKSEPNEKTSWNDVSVWTTDPAASSTSTASTVVPSLGDTVRVTKQFRTISQSESGKTYYFLATTYKEPSS